jgi:cell wall-associated NlpC family hydrolase
VITVEDLITRARTWVGVPFHHQGRTRFGVDCIGLPESVLREAGELPADYRERTDYGRRPTAELEAGLARWCTPIEAPIPGALLAIHWPRHGGVSHVAIFTGSTLIHAYLDHGVCEHPYRGQWVQWTASSWRMPGVLYE